MTTRNLPARRAFLPVLALLFAMVFAFALQLSATQTAFGADDENANPAATAENDKADSEKTDSAKGAESADNQAEPQKAAPSEESGQPAEAAEPEPVKEAAPEPEPVQETATEPEPVKEATPEPEAEPVKEVADQPEAETPAAAEQEQVADAQEATPAETAAATKQETAAVTTTASNQETTAKATTTAATAKATTSATSAKTTTTQSSKSSTATANKTTSTAKSTTTAKTAKRASKAITSVTVKNVVYTGKSLKPAVTVKSGNTTLKLGRDYKISYKNNKAKGTAKVTVTGIGSYSGTKTATFTIFGAAKYKSGASRMPISSASKWTLKNATLVVTSGKGVVSVKGGTVTGLKKGIATISIRDKVGKTIARKAVSVYGFAGKVKLRLASTNTLYLQANSKSKKNGANISVGNKSSKNWQSFTFSRNSDGSYSIISSYSKKYVQVEKGSLENNANVYQWKKLNRDRDRQHWKITVDANNRLTFVNVATGKALSVTSKAVNGANAVQYKNKAKTSQKWVVTGSLDETKVASATSVATKASAGASQAGIAIAAQAVKISYSRTVYQAQGKGTKHYLSVAKTLAKNDYYIKNKNQLRCNVPVACAVRGSGVDKSFPTSLLPMYTYMKKSAKWKCLGNFSGREGALQPGDVLIRIGTDKGKANATTYKKNGVTYTNKTSHACIYVGKQMAQSGYTLALKGTDADKGKPATNATFVSGHTSKKNAAKRSAACLESAKAAYGDFKMLVFRYVG